MSIKEYSPDLNTIEHVWANLKRFILTNDKRQNNLSLAIEQSIPSGLCVNYIRIVLDDNIFCM